MKIRSLSCLTGLLLGFFVATVSAQDGAGQQVIIQVDGLSCPFCVYGLEKHLKQVPGVVSVTTDIKHGQAIVRLQPGSRVTDKLLQAAVKKAGFTARSIKHP